MKAETRSRLFVLLLAPTLACFACTQRMALQGRGSPDLVRRPPEGTVASGQLERVSAPTRITRALLERGRERFNLNCTPCHGYAGFGDGVLPQRGFLAPPSYHQERLRDSPDQHFFDAMTQGYGAMYSYADRVDEADRWAVVAYIRALQLSQNPPAAKLSAIEKARIEQEDHP